MSKRSTKRASVAETLTTEASSDIERVDDAATTSALPSGTASPAAIEAVPSPSGANAASAPASPLAESEQADAAATRAEPVADDDVAANEATIVLDDVSVFYGEVVGLSRVKLGFSRGITGLVGPNGSGKTTLMRLLTGLLAPREGTVSVLGRDPFVSAELRSRIGFVPATECFYDVLSARRNLEIAFLARGLPGAAARERAQQALRAVGLEADGARRYRTWSRGMRQRLKLALALSSDVDLVLLDEPFLGVDPPSRRHIRDLVAELGERGCTVLISSHVLHEIESLTDRVAILSHGRVLGLGRIETLLAALRHNHPHRIRLQTEQPRELAKAAVAAAHVHNVRIVDARTVEILSTQPDAAFAELAQWIAEAGALVRGVESPDDSLEALFAQVTAAGVQRL